MSGNQSCRFSSEFMRRKPLVSYCKHNGYFNLPAFNIMGEGLLFRQDLLGHLHSSAAVPREGAITFLLLAWPEAVDTEVSSGRRQMPAN
jgi:hypothetical protein